MIGQLAKPAGFRPFDPAVAGVNAFIGDRPWWYRGLAPDGEAGDAGVTIEVPSKTLHEAQRSPIFWIYSLSLAMHALFGTALTFHVVSIFAEAGRDSAEAFAYFFPAAIFATTVNLLASCWLADRISLKPFIIAM